MRQREQLECPADFARDLADLFGVNCYGEPMFRMIWGQTETEIQLTAEGYYEPCLLGHDQPCWILQMWEPAETYGPQEVFYALNTDLETGLPVMAYPEFGRYREIATFLFKKYDAQNRKLDISTITLDPWTLDQLLPIMLASLNLSEARKRSIIDEAEAAEQAEQVELIASRLADELPAFYGPVSYAGQAVRTALIDRKMAEIESIWRKFNLKRPPMRGFFQKPS